jgi:polyphosphate glucokinase
MKLKKILGLDIGGSGIKGAIVDTKNGKLLTDRYRIATPSPATPDAVAEVIKKVAAHFDWDGAIGAGYPGVVQNGIVRTAANVDKSWINTDIDKLITKVTKCPAHVLNDADAAGMAEMKFGAGAGFKGVVMLVTIGTGLGTVMFTGGKLVPNLELGHIILKGDDAEKYASDAARKNDNLSWEDWGKRFNEYLLRLEYLVWPDLIILGGGASKKEDLFLKHLTTRAKVVPAQYQNNAGMVGAALAAKAQFKEK